jgi:hypothetical protein
MMNKAKIILIGELDGKPHRAEFEVELNWKSMNFADVTPYPNRCPAKLHEVMIVGWDGEMRQMGRLASNFYPNALARSKRKSVK